MEEIKTRGYFGREMIVREVDCGDGSELEIVYKDGETGEVFFSPTTSQEIADLMPNSVALKLSKSIEFSEKVREMLRKSRDYGDFVCGMYRGRVCEEMIRGY